MPHPEQRTHPKIDPHLSGTPTGMAPGWAEVELVTAPEMAADGRGLVHGGFVFSLADYAAMLAVNEPTVVLAGAEVRFRAPVVVGERLVAEARVRGTEGRKAWVEVTVRRGTERVLDGELTCVTLETHVLDATAGRV